jgi:hypothetical protein
LEISREDTQVGLADKIGKPKPIKKKLIVPFRKEKKLNGGVAILLKKNRFWLI